MNDTDLHKRVLDLYAAAQALVDAVGELWPGEPIEDPHAANVIIKADRVADILRDLDRLLENG
jgi:hypothetical protein